MLLMGCGAEQAIKKGDRFYALGEYFDASTQYKKAYSQTPAKERTQRGKVALKMAECYRKINYTQKAIAAYNNAIRYKQTDSLTYLYLGQQQMKNGNYKDAEKAFQTFLDSAALSTNLSPCTSLAKTGIRSAQKAPQWKKEGSQYTVKREHLFDSRRADYSPMLAGEENNQLFFTSTRNQAKGDELSGITGTKNADIFMSQKDEKGKWQRPEVIDSELNSDDDEGACCFSPDGKTMYLTQCRTDASYPRYATIVTSKRSDAAWSKTTELTITRDTLSAYAHPAVSPDGEWLYFASNMPGGQGGYDIWRIRLTSNGLGGVENLGAPINTPGDELFPTFRPNGDLYFSSDGHPGMGGLDILKATPDSVRGWIVENQQFPLNSSMDDFGMTFDGVHNRGLFCSSRNDGKGWEHIYSFELPEVLQTVTGWVYEKDGYELPEGLVYMVGNDGTNEKVSVRADGSFTKIIKPNVSYVFLGTCKGYLNVKQELRVSQSEESEDYVLQFPLPPINIPVLIDNIFYEYDKATLLPESKEALDRLVVMMEENPNITIELSSHCDYRGSDFYNERLAQRRAESVVNYMIEHGVAKARLTAVGYGESRPKVVRKRLAAQHEFLHEGDTLTEAFIKQLPDEEKQEVCNALNRRTEFRVLRTTYGLTLDEYKEQTDAQREATKPEDE